MNSAGLDAELPNDINRRKAEFRRRGLAARRAMADRDEASRRIAARVRELPEWSRAETVMCFVAMEDEVDTRALLAEVMSGARKLVVPFCHGNELGLFHLQDFEELQPGSMRIMEPRAELRGLPQKTVSPLALDLILVPGVAFDSSGGRVGFGKGYYDRLLARVRADAVRIGLAFACQMFDAVPVDSHDMRLDFVVTEVAVCR